MNSTKKILFFIAFLLGLSFHSYSQSPDHKTKTDKFGGIGVSVDIDSSVMLPYIVDILSAKPGAMAGLRSGDHIISINGWKTKGKSQEQVAGKLRGRVGSEVKMLVNRGGKDVSFEMKREHIEVNEKAGNFCEIFDTLIKSMPDSFYNIQGEKINKTYHWPTEYKPKVQFPGFDSSKIVKQPYIVHYTSYFFIGRDSIQAMNQCKRLISEIRDCLPYTVVKKFEEYELQKQSDRFWYIFTITGVKNSKYDNCGYWNINVIRECESNKSFSVQIRIDHPSLTH